MVEGFPLKAGFRLTASQAASSSGRVAFFILLDIVDEPMNGSSYAQCSTPRYLKTVQFSSVNLDGFVKSQNLQDSPIQYSDNMLK
jgi:hypothetical protein